ncbi:MAG: hypothetical protein FK730_14220 [Asgard group archaeon]|nr:hypothetical protein [Asgard group archaeon]
MNKEIFQIASLTAYANAYIKGKKVSFEKNNPAAISYDKIKFVNELPIETHLKKVLIAKDPNSWFKYLKKNKFSRLYLRYHTSTYLQKKDRKITSSIGESNFWHILAQKKEKYDVWKSEWKAIAGDEMAFYLLLTRNANIGEIRYPSLDTTKLFLKEILTDLVAFTEKNKLTNWEKIFQKAIDCLNIQNSDELIQKDYLPVNCYSLEAKQILASCDQAWVFGGMGSWNDVVRVQDYDLYRRLTANLYDTLCKSIVSAINSYPK